MTTHGRDCRNNAAPKGRRAFFKTSVLAAGAIPLWFATSGNKTSASSSPNERPVLGCIGTGTRWKEFIFAASRHSDCAALSDVDSQHLEKAYERLRNRKQDAKVDLYGDYRRLLDRKDIDVVTIATPDHWHTKIAIDAMKAGKDVYCEKPLTLTIDEGKQIIKVLEETKRVFQVGTQQRSEMRLRFLTAVAMIKEGRIGRVKRAVCNIGAAPKKGPFATAAVPANLNWKLWLGQTPLVDYIPERCHYSFRFWYEYSGGKMTDWGAHHVDIAQWAIGMDHTGPTRVEALTGRLPVPFKDGYPITTNEFNTAIEFHIRCLFPNGVEIVIQHDDDNNGILFEGTAGQIRVSRGFLKGAAVEELKSKPLSEDLITRLYKGKRPGDHLRNFFECVRTRDEPISDVYTHHRAITTCHLANITLRLGRALTWDPQTQQIVGDTQAQSFQSREQRRGYEITG
jgi:predicted dehydrogenase